MTVKIEHQTPSILTISLNWQALIKRKNVKKCIEK